MMRKLAVLTFPLMMLFLIGCADETTAPDLDLELTATFKKPPKPPPPPPPTVDPANPVLAFDAGNHRKRGGLWVSDADGGNMTQIYNIGGGAYFRPAWSPNGAGTVDDPYEILYWVPWSIGKVRVVINAEGKPARLGNPEVLSTDVNYVRIAVSPNGDELVALWHPIDGTSPSSKLVLIEGEDFESGDTIYTSDSDVSIGAPAWSWDGNRIAFLEESSSGVTLKVLDLLTGSASPVYTQSTGGPSFNLSWARDSDRLVFDIDGTMYRLDVLDGSGTPTSIGPGYGPVWSPDDTQIVYDTRAGVYVKTLDGSQEDVSIGGQWFSDWRRNPAQ